ncbi:MAG: hydrogenase 4 subunit F [Candidatus Omnitrophota bacterium]
MNFQRIKTLGIAHAVLFFCILCASAAMLYRVAVQACPIPGCGFFLLDGLSVFFIFVIGIVGFAAAVYSIGYISRDVRAGNLSPRKAAMYYILFDLFIGSMFMVVAVNNLGFMWAAIEMTTLVSAFLVGFYRTKQSIEAAWKYIIICSVGIILALLGTIFFSYAVSVAGGPKSLNWTDLYAVAARLDKNIVRIAFIFILVGYGTKAGLAPMHTWLPDAHSQALAPISALLSGVLLKTALYAIIRFGLVVNKCLGGPGYFSHLMIMFGLVSLGIAAGLLLVQKDLKRLLAYSSIEHVGVICVGLGIGGPLATFGVLLHILNHAVTKSLMFFGAGNIVSRYGQHNMRMIHGVVQSMPFTGTMFLAGTFALAGFPPFSIFMSELLIIIAGFTKGAYGITGALLFFLALAFGAVIYQVSRILFGRQPKGMARIGEPLSAKLAFIFLSIFILVLGSTVPWVLKCGISAANEILKGI